MKRKSLLFTLVPLLSLGLVGCSGTAIPIASSENQAINESNGEYLLDLYSINDFHGAVVEDLAKLDDDDKPAPEPGIERLGGFIRGKRDENLGGSIFLANGDMFQGSADSNITEGKMVMEMMNYLDFESTSLGNHEFDWTLESLGKSLEAVEAKFEVLACNIFRKGTANTENPESIILDYPWIKPYKTITRGVEGKQLKIGIIGSIGSSLTTSILASLVKDYDFMEPASYVRQYSEYLKNEENCDVIVYTTHGDGNDTASQGTLEGYINQDIPNYVDVIFTGHAHRELNKTMARTDGSLVPVMQGKGGGAQMSYVQLGVNTSTKAVRTVKQEVLGYDTFKKYSKDKSMKIIYKNYYDSLIKDIKEEKLGKIDSAKTEEQIAELVVNETLKWANSKDNTVVAAVINGKHGIRSTWKKGTITFGDVYKTLPFDNAQYFVTIRKSQLAGIESAVKGGFYTAKSSAYNKAGEDDIVRVCLLSYVAEFSPNLLEDPFSNTVSYNTFSREIVAQAFRDHPKHNPFLG